MKIQFFPTLRNYRKEYLAKDIFSGVIIAAVSIPISMGYAQISGLPAAYGLYGSLLPIILFALFSTSRQFIFGVDAAPAAIVGAVILLCATGSIGYLPVPVLTAIVISALLNVVEVHLAVRLFRVSRQEFFIFMAAFVVVLFLGTIYGVLAGILLSFVARDHKSHESAQTFPGNDTWKTGIL